MSCLRDSPHKKDRRGRVTTWITEAILKKFARLDGKYRKLEKRVKALERLEERRMRKKYSLFIGRYQPFHDGHKKLMETVLNEGKDICIAIRDVETDENNPYSATAVLYMIYDAMRKWVEEDRCKIIIIPDIEEVCYGRKVGWGIREIRLDQETEKISATKIREFMEK